MSIFLLSLNLLNLLNLNILSLPPSQSAIDEVAEADINSTTVVELERLAAVDAHGIPLEAAAANVAMAEFSSDDEPLTFASLFTDASDSEAEGEIDESLLVANCNLSDVTVKALAERGIQSLFAIQKVVFEPAMAGSDVVARAKTGSGKTLAFALPVVEKIMAARGDDRSARGRNPKCIVLAPTRELAKQVEREFASVAPTLKTGCYYGGTPIGPQLRELQRGMDIVVGTPGRIIDLIGQRALNLSEVSRRPQHGHSGSALFFLAFMFPVSPFFTMFIFRFLGAAGLIFVGVGCGVGTARTVCCRGALIVLRGLEKLGANSDARL